MLNYNMLYVHQSKVNKILLFPSKNDSFFCQKKTRLYKSVFKTG